jgi:uncharacterized protein YidB (DUF937 family)
MGLFDGLAGELGGLIQGGQAQSGDVVSALLNSGETPGGMGGVLETLAANGLAEHVAAWTSGVNVPITPEQLHDALGSEQVQQMAQASGLPVGDFLQHLAAHLPQATAEAST